MRNLSGSCPSPPARLRGALAASLALSLVVACQTTGRPIATPAPQPPLAELVAPPSYLTPRSQRYRVAVRPFVDQTGQAASVSDAAADVLVTALDAEGRFSLYDASSEEATVRDAPAAPVDAEAPASASRTGRYADLAPMVDGVLESHVTAIRVDAQGNGSFEVDYRMVDPHSRMVVASGNATIRVRDGAALRQDFQRLATALGGRFVPPERMGVHEVAVREIDLEGGDVKLTLDGGADEEVRRGAVGFVVEPDPIARVDRYLAKFVVVSVFQEASVGVVVEHCNAVGRCETGQAVPPVQQAQNVHIGSRVRFK